MTTPERDLSLHTARNYAKGRSLPWVVLWHVVNNAVFQKWWFPARLRPRLLRAFGARVSDDVVIREEVHVQWPWNLRIDGPTWIGQRSWLLSVDAEGPIHIERDVCLSQEVMLCAGSHDRKSPGFEHTNAPIRIERGTWLCARSTILPGTVVGDHAIVGAGAVVRGAVAPSTIVGAPSGERKDGTIRLPSDSRSLVNGQA